MKPRLLIVTSHPIQYQAPWFRALHADGRIDVKVLFLSLPNRHQQGVGFAHAFEWDVPLLDGYEWQLAPSAAGTIRDGWWGLGLRDAKTDLMAEQPDAVLATGWQNRGMLQCLLAARRLRLPLLVRAESNGLQPLNGLRRARCRWIVRQADRLLPIGKSNRHFYERLGCVSQLSVDVPYFVDNRFFAERCESAQPQREQLRLRFGIPERALCFVFVGKFVDKKRPEDLLEAMRELTGKTDVPVHLLMVGTGPLETRLRQRAARAGLPVTFTGFLNQTEIPEAYTVADYLVLPSDYGETWGLVVNEAMACGLPAIVSDRVGCGPDLVRDGETGFTFRFGSVAELATRLAEIALMDADARHAMGQRARELVFREYSVERAVENTVAAVQGLAGRDHGRADH